MFAFEILDRVEAEPSVRFFSRASFRKAVDALFESNFCDRGLAGQFNRKLKTHCYALSIQSQPSTTTLREWSKLFLYAVYSKNTASSMSKGKHVVKQYANRRYVLAVAKQPYEPTLCHSLTLMIDNPLNSQNLFHDNRNFIYSRRTSVFTLLPSSGSSLWKSLGITRLGCFPIQEETEDENSS